MSEFFSSLLKIGGVKAFFVGAAGATYLLFGKALNLSLGDYEGLANIISLVAAYGGGALALAGIFNWLGASISRRSYSWKKFRRIRKLSPAAQAYLVLMRNFHDDHLSKLPQEMRNTLALNEIKSAGVGNYSTNFGKCSVWCHKHYWHIVRDWGQLALKPGEKYVQKKWPKKVD